MHFSRSHSSMLIRYLGVSFITGAISHGFFSGTRSLLTWGLGIVLFIIGSLLEEWADKQDSWKIITMWAVLAVGIGSFTGGFQHFPDSPERSVWILPLGFVISLGFYALIHQYPFGKKEYLYSIISGLLITGISLGLYVYLKDHHLNISTPTVQKSESTDHPH